MIFGLVKKNQYQDSVNLMLLSSRLSGMDNLDRVSIMMGTPANKDIFKNTGMYVEEFDQAKPNDICIGVEARDKEMLKVVEKELEAFILDMASSTRSSNLSRVKSLQTAINKMEDANLALISIPGEYVYEEGKKLLEKGVNLFIFSDNVSLDEERALKDLALKKDLIVMGPDCGTGIINKTPLAFANNVNTGNIGVIGASGTGIQEITSLISRAGGGISQAIGIGGRDLQEEIGGISAKTALKMLEEDKETEVIVFVSKPPAKGVMDMMIEQFRSIDKPLVALFLGVSGNIDSNNVYYTKNLEEASYLALYLSKKDGSMQKNLDSLKEKLKLIRANPKKRQIHGYYGGGTLAGESKLILKKELQKDKNSTIIDFGDDEYTKGRPHPMIDPTTRIQAFNNLKDNKEVAIVLFDNVIGYGANQNMANSLKNPIKDLLEYKKKQNDEIIIIGSVCGTDEDIQGYKDQVNILEEAGAIVVESNASAAKLAKEALEYLNDTRTLEEEDESFLNKPLKIINVGLMSFAQTLFDKGASVIQYDWSPIAGGNKELQRMLNLLKDK